ncbi:methyltransferase domain-containing protein [Henriciella sp.]|uniref:class I SAM-dependent methyltransferase n=1 Tax=Henriciella sp. TaxID=1968823 RepID=UPI0026185DAA|nr:methyltransferase domain-containing protein [Henriciella sp.]
MKRILGTGLLTLALAACGSESNVEDTPAAPQPPAETTDEGTTSEDGANGTEGAQTEAGQTSFTVDDAMAGSWRTDEETARDQYRNPAETLEFFGIEGDDTVVEIWPGGGWYTNILAPWLNENGGQLITATYNPERSERAAQVVEDFKTNYNANPDTFGTIDYTVFGAESGALTEPGTVDAVLTFRNLHNWMSGDYAEKFFDDAYASLKPGGVLGVVEHRLPSSTEQDPSAASGYVHEDYVKGLAEAAGFEFEASSDINANPDDTADHPFGVWTLPPVSRTEDADGNTPEDFNPQTYLDIGESDRMTLKFVKPADDGSDGAMKTDAETEAEPAPEE